MGLLRRTAAVLGVLLAVTTAFVAGVAFSPGHDGRASRLLLSGQDLGSGLPCGQLRQWYVAHALDQVTAWGWQGPPIYDGVEVPAPGVGAAQPEARPADGAVPGTSLDTATTSATGTNVQETGVDEPDVAKAVDGLLVRVQGDRLLTYDVSGRQPRALGSAALVLTGNPQVLLAGDRAVVLGSVTEDPAAGAPPFPPTPRTWVRTFDLSDPAHPTEVDARQYDGTLVSARQTGDVVRLVLSSGLPSLDFTRPDSTGDQKAALAMNRAVVRHSTIQDWLPTVSSGDPAVTSSAVTRTGLVDCSDVEVPDSFGGLGTLSVVGFAATAPGDVSTTAVATGSEVAYMAPGHLYVATSPWSGGPVCCGGIAPSPAGGATHLYAFDLAGTAARYVGAGTVDGYVASSASMDEHQGVLRVALGSAAASSATSVVVLRPESGRLAEVGRLDGLGPGQQLKSVRWFDDLAVLVTFRQIDPFYVVDLADPARPHLLGVLHLPGWSSYLHPVGPHLLLGLGQAAPQRVPVDEPPVPLPTAPTVGPLPTRPTVGPLPPRLLPSIPHVTVAPATPSASPVGGPPPTQPPAGGGVGRIRATLEHAKATLFDITDLAHPRALATVRYPAGSLARAGLEPHQVTWLPQRHTLLTVVSRGYAGVGTWVSVLTVTGGTLHDRLLPVPPTPDVNGVRTVPLDDGRVVLVAGDTVRFLPL
jgi:beta propeller domain-containing protein